MHTERTAEGIYFLKNESFQNVSFSVLSQYQPIAANARSQNRSCAGRSEAYKEGESETYVSSRTKSKDQKRQIIDKHDLTMHMEKTSRSQK